jgi:hypothetical protein
MIKKIKQYLAMYSAAVMMFLPVGMVATSATAYAAEIGDNLACANELNFDPSKKCTPKDAQDEVNNTLRLAINILTLIVGVISVIMIIVGGLKYITSGGDSSNVQGAKNTIMYAIIGLVVVALAQIIVNFVLGNVGKV